MLPVLPAVSTHVQTERGRQTFPGREILFSDNSLLSPVRVPSKRVEHPFQVVTCWDLLSQPLGPPRIS